MRRIASSLILSGLCLSTGQALADADASGKIETVTVTAQVNSDTASATGLPLTLRQTPQSVTMIGRDRIDDFALTDTNELLDQVPGINVERVETDRTDYNSRGFGITSFQVDGIGLPEISDLQFGGTDTALWERVDVVRGANGLMTGVGNPSATINYIRKRPTPDLQASLTASVGSWDDKRLEADVSGPLTGDGDLQGRAIYAHEDRNSYLDYNHLNRNVYAGLLAWTITPRLTATVGYSLQQNNEGGVLWGALPLSYSDGAQIRDYPTSASTSASWTTWDTRDQTAFAELAYAIGDGWSAKGILTYRRFHYRAKLLYAYDYPDPVTGLGVEGVTGLYPSTYNQLLGDFYASGPFTLFGREHQLAFGVSTGTSSGREYEGQDPADIVIYPDYRDWSHDAIPQPTFPTPILQSHTTDRLTRAYAAAHLNFTDALKAVAGVSVAWLKTTGTSYGTDESRKASKVSPYVGLLYDLTENITAYASYTSIFNPQTEVDFNNRKLAPAEGDAYEGGFKSQWFNDRLYAAASVFRAKQSNLATYAGDFGPGDPGPIGGSYYVGTDTTSTGFELEAAGHITDRWSLNGGFTAFKLRDDSHTNPSPYIPNRTLKLGTSYSVPEWNDLKLGAQLRWQGRIHYDDPGVTTVSGSDAIVRQGSYAVLDLMAGVDVVDHLRATLNVRNVTDKKYLASLLWGQAFYAEPRAATFSLTYRY